MTKSVADRLSALVAVSIGLITTSTGAQRQPHSDAPSRTHVVLGVTGDHDAPVGGVEANPTQATIDACRGCDVLVHEVLTLEWLAKPPDFQNYAARHHTTTTQLIELASKAKPRLLVLYHASLSLRPTVDAERSTPAALLREMSAYSGHVVVGRDLDVY